MRTGRAHQGVGARKFSEIFKAMRAEAVRDLEELADELEREDCAADPELN